MKWNWLIIAVVLFGFFIFITTPLDSSVYTEYMEAAYNSKGNFVSKKNFEVKMQIKQEGTNSSTPITNPSGGGAQMSANVQETPGVAQGLWSNSSGATLTPDEFADIAKSVASDAQKYIDVFGMSPASTGMAEVKVQDSWKDKFSDGVGIMHYIQGGAAPWSSFRHKFEHQSHGSIFGGNDGSGCGTTAMSIIFSTMLHKYITPAEAAAAIGTYNKRYGTNFWFHTTETTLGALDQSSKLELIFTDPKFNGQSLLSCDHDPGQLKQDKVDACLNAGGMVMWVSGGSKKTGPYWAGGGGHWVVIRERTSSGKYLCVDGANGAGTQVGNPACLPDTENDFSVLYKANADPASGGAKYNIYYVTPGPGYQDYMSSLK